MKKLVFLFLLFPFISYADIVDNLKSLDILINEKQYNRAEDYARNLLDNSNISDSDKKLLKLVLKDIESKKAEQVEDTTDIEKKDEQDISGLPKYRKINKDDFLNYSNYEEKVIETKDPRAIYALAKLYASDGLYQKAMEIALKDQSGQDYNIYIAATAARLIGNYDISINLYNKLLNNNPNDAKSLLGMAMAYKGIDDINDALIYMQKYYNIQPSEDILQDIKLMNLALRINK